jgi:hypothetical protein
MEAAWTVLEKGGHPEQSETIRLRRAHQIKAGVWFRNGHDERQRTKTH